MGSCGDGETFLFLDFIHASRCFLTYIVNQTKEGNVRAFMSHQCLSKYVPGPFSDATRGENHQSLYPCIEFRVPLRAVRW